MIVLYSLSDYDLCLADAELHMQPQKIIIALALVAFVVFMGYTIMTSMGLL